jgi:hypothetical protein
VPPRGAGHRHLHVGTEARAGRESIVAVGHCIVV